MNQDGKDSNRVQELFLAALEIPVQERGAWLAEQCGDEPELLGNVRSLLDHDSPDEDPLEKKLEEALGDLPDTDAPSVRTEQSKNEEMMVDSEIFLSKLSEVGVLSQEEIDALNKTVASGEGSPDPRQLASQLVREGRLTDYQASALLHGQPDLLIDKYLILDLLDAGGMGMVFKAIHRPMNRTVAVKMIAQHLLAAPEQVKRFQREVRVAATLEHPNIVRSYDADQSRGIHFLVMEYVRGENLSKTVQRQGPLSVEQAVDCIRQAAKGLRYAQQKGVIHRDIKPGNLMLGGEGIVKVLDLGLANIDESFRLAQQSSITGDRDSHSAQSLAGSELTTAGAVLGTVSFMAPEQSLDARTADTRADIYSLGCTLYYLLIGEAPYHGDTIFQVFMLHREGEIPALRDKRPDVPEQVEAVCRKMLAKSPEERYQSMGELLEAIEDCNIAPPPEALRSKKSKASDVRDIGSTVTYASQETQAGTQSKSRSPLGWLIALVLLLALGGVYWWWQNNASQDDTPTQIADTTPADDGVATSVTQPVAAATPQYGLKFDGDGDYVELPHFGYNGMSPLTLEVWYTSPILQGKHKRMLSLDGTVWLEATSDPADAGWQLSGATSENQVDFARLDKAQIVNRRTHLAFVYDGNHIRAFHDGQEQPVQYVRYSRSTQTGTNIERFAFATSTEESGFLGRSLAGNKERDFTGTIDEVRISTSVRYTEDFTPVDRFEADADTLALYHFDEGEGDVLTDSSGNGHDGKIVGAQWVKVYDEANLSAADLLATGEYEWQVIEELPIPDDHVYLAGADMSADGLTLVISSGKTAGSYGKKDLWIATRPSVDSPWSVFENLGDAINSDAGEFHPALSHDGLTLYFARPGSVNQVSWRDSRDAAWSPAEPSDLPGGFFPPDPTPNGRYLLTAVNGIASISKRSSADGPWPSTATLAAPINIEGRHFSCGAIGEDGRLLVFNGSVEYLKGPLWMSLRADEDSAWPEPIIVESLELEDAGFPRLLPDGKSMLIGNEDAIYLARLVRKPTSPIATRSVSEGPGEANLSAADLLATGEYDWQVVEKLPEPINSPYYESTADMTADGLMIVFGSNRPGGAGAVDLWTSTRESRDAPWSEPIHLTNINGETRDDHPSLFGDGTTLVFNRAYPIQNLVTRRISSASPWSEAQQLSDSDIGEIADVTADGLAIVTTRGAALWTSRRTSVDSSWGEYTAWKELNIQGEWMVAGTLSTDGRLLVF